MSENLEQFPITTQQSRDVLNEKQLVDYRNRRESFIRWLMHLGKDPKMAEGYSRDTVRGTAYRTDQFNRWVWAEENGYSMTLTHAHADDYMRELLYSETSATHKSNIQKALKRYFNWIADEKDGKPWEPKRPFSTSIGDDSPRDFLTTEERTKIREAALQYGSIPSYSSVTPKERSRWKAHLAQRFGKPKSEVTPDDWDRANSWKYTSLVWTSLDCGLRPIEVERAKTSWVDLDNGVLRIPKEDSAKNEGNWVVALTDRTVDALDHWLQERGQYEKYNGTEMLWLTREENPYQSQSLRRLLLKLCEMASIPVEYRKMSWYALRHSTGTAMTHHRGLAATKAQLRHKSEQTTMKYDNVPAEHRRDALERM